MSSVVARTSGASAARPGAWMAVDLCQRRMGWQTAAAEQSSLVSGSPLGLSKREGCRKAQSQQTLSSWLS